VFYDLDVCVALPSPRICNALGGVLSVSHHYPNISFFIHASDFISFLRHGFDFPTYLQTETLPVRHIVDLGCQQTYIVVLCLSV